jgi:Flp pilus assembly protein TadD
VDPIEEPGTSTWHGLNSRQAALVAAVWTLILLVFGLAAHTTPYYRVETDLVGEYLPAARELMNGTLDPAHYSFKGPGYPLLVAGAARVLRTDVAIASRVIAPIAAGIAAWLVFAIVYEAGGGQLAAFAFLAFLSLPETVRYAIEAGTDAPALALMLAATWLVVRPRGWRSVCAAGFLTAAAILTRSNAAFLCLAAIPLIASRPGRIRGLAAYLLSLAMPLIAWQWAAARVGGLPPDRNYLNVAWELYGRGVPWVRFEQGTGSHFHSMLDVFTFAPLQALGTVALNLFVHRWLDLQRLVPIWIGVLAAPGLLLLARLRSARAWLLHAVACALVLAPVFHSARFALYLAPVYAAAAGASLFWIAEAVSDLFGITSRRLAPVLAVALLLASAGVAVSESRAALMQSPHEVRLAGAELVRFGLTGQSILARKPHVAWFSGLRYVPLPEEIPLANVPSWATARGVHYLFYSPIERMQIPGFGVLADSGLALPGFTQLCWRRTAPQHFYALYRLEPGAADTVAFRSAYRDALRRHETAHPTELEEKMFVACEWLAIGEPTEALAQANALIHAGVNRGEVHRLRSDALVALERWDDAEAACRAAMLVEPTYGWHWERLGLTAWNRGRLDEAREDMTHALGIEPANLRYLEMLARIDVNRHEPAAAAATLERALQLAPADVRLRQMAMGAWQMAGQPANAEKLFAAGVAAGVSPAALSGEGGPSH